jgi:hypothetical protein
MDNKAKEPMAEQIATLEREIAQALRLGCSAVLIADAQVALSRVRAEKALTDHMEVVRAGRPLRHMPPIKELEDLLKDAERQFADSELTTAATVLLHSAEAEFGLTTCMTPFAGLELCLEMQHRADINRLKAAMAVSQRDDGHPGQLAEAKRCLKRLTFEVRVRV